MAAYRLEEHLGSAPAWFFYYNRPNKKWRAESESRCAAGAQRGRF